VRHADIRTEHIAEFHHWMESDVLSEKAKKRLNAIVYYFEHKTSIEQTASLFGTTPSALRRWLDSFNPEKPSSLEEKNRRPKTVRTSDIDEKTAECIREYRKTLPRIGKEEIAVKLVKEHGAVASASSIARLIESECLYFADCPLHRRKRLHAAMKGKPITLITKKQSTTTSAPTLSRWFGVFKWMQRSFFILALLCITFFGITKTHAAVNAKTLFVNTEAFQTIDNGDQSTNVELRFGSIGESIYWDVVQNQFDITDDLHVDNNITGSGGLAIEANIRAKADITLNSDNDTNNAVLTFGNSTLVQTLSFIHASQKFRFSVSLDVAGTISGSVLRASNMTVSGAVVYSSGSQLMQTAKGSSGQLLISQATSAPKWANPVGGMIWYFDGTQAVTTSKGPQITMPFALTLSGITLKAKGAPTGAALIYDINKDGTTIFSTRPQINAGATNGGTGAVFSTTNLTVNSVLTIDIDQVGSTFAGSGITVMLKGTRRY
jgi:hypothetical protein